MRRFRAGLLWMLFAAAIGGGLVALFWAFGQVPDFYEAALEKQPEPAVRRESARVFEQRTLQLADGIQHADQWAEEFTQTQINSWLSEELPRKFGQVLPEGVSDPRVELAGKSLSVGFRYNRGQWNSVVSVRIRPWVPQPNQLAFEIESIRAGLVPIPLEHILHELSDHLKTEGLRIEWSELHGNEVVILHLGSVKEGQPVLEGVQVIEGAIRVAGRRGIPSLELKGTPARESDVGQKRVSVSREATNE